MEIEVDKCRAVGQYHTDEAGCPFLQSQGCNVDFTTVTDTYIPGFPDGCPLNNGPIIVKIKEKR